MNSRAIRVIVADDHKLFRSGLVQLLHTHGDIRVVAEAKDREETLHCVEHVAADVLTLDIGMPNVQGCTLIEEVRDANPDLAILALSMYEAPSIVRQALIAGARGYLTKDSDPESVIEAIARLAQGGRFLSPTLAESLAFEFNDNIVRPGADSPLSERELEVLRLIIETGLPLVEIGNRLGLNAKTITTHKSNIMKKLGVSSNVALIRVVLDKRLLD